MVINKGLIGEYYGIQGTTWTRPADPRAPVRDARDPRPEVRAPLRRRPPAAGRLAEGAASTGSEHAAADAVRAGDAGDRQSCGTEPQLRVPAAIMTANRSASSAWAGSAWSPQRASPSSATRSGRATSCRRRSTRSRAGEVPIYEPGLAELVEKNRDRLHFTPDMGEVIETPSCSSAASTRRPPTPATPTSRASSAWSRSSAARPSTRS